MTHVEHDLVTHPEHMCSPSILVGFLFARFFFHRFLCSVLHIIVCPFVIFLLAVVLSVLLFTACDYLFGIFQNFLFLIQDFRQEEKG